MRKFLLSTGQSTDKLEYYVLDLFKMYMNVNPGDIPGAPNMGFSFDLSDVLKRDLRAEIKSRLSTLIQRMQKTFDPAGVNISLAKLDIVDETLAKVVIEVNNIASDEIILKLINE